MSPDRRLKLTVIGMLTLITVLALTFGFLSSAYAKSSDLSLYYRIDTGAFLCDDTSNADPVECGENPSPLLLGSFGFDYGYIASDIKVGYYYVPTHGENTGIPGRSAEGDGYGHVVVMLFNLWPNIEIYDSGLELYAGGGVGPAWVRMFGEDDINLAWEVGAGAYYPFTKLIQGHLGYRYGSVLETEHGEFDLPADVSGHSIIVGFRVLLEPSALDFLF